MTSTQKQNAAGLLCGLALAALLFVGGCQTGVSKDPVERPDGTDVVKGHESKDAKVLGAADNIDAEVKGTSVEAPVNAQTNAIREAVAANPAIQIEELVKAFNTALDAMQKQLDQARAEAQAAKDAELKRQQAILRWLGVLFLVAGIAGAVVSKGTLAIEGAASSAIGMLFFAAAQIIGKVWFLPVCGGIILLIFGLIGWWWYGKFRESKKRQDADFMARQMTEKLGQIKSAFIPTIKALDNAYDDGKAKLLDLVRDKKVETVQDVLDLYVHDRQSSLMSPDAKKVVHELRAEA